MRHFKSLMRTVAHLGGIGYLPAPGTCASLVAAGVWWYIPRMTFVSWLVAVAALVAASIFVISWALDESGIVDPPTVVIDEWVGMWCGLLLVPHTIEAVIATVILFRIFDIAKPTPINYCEALPAGYGVVMDDVAAGFAAGSFVRFFLILSVGLCN